jgi:hypothetical protein
MSKAPETLQQFQASLLRMTVEKALDEVAL